ncbi:MAG: DNA repair protein RecO [Desulfocapsaceae bacterium]|nr:DNA repair protein RecO [Desulfocapsaceae bacterium]
MSSISRETTAIVLNSRDHGESDKIITFYTRDFGKITGIAKGANKSKKRFLNKLELFSHLALSYQQKTHSSLVFVIEAELHSSFIEIRSNIESYVAATLIREVLLLATVEGEGDLKVFNLLHWALQSLADQRSDLEICTVFLLRLFDTLGYRPDFSHCCRCGNTFDVAEQYSFLQVGAGLVCSRCKEKVEGTLRDLSTGTIRLLHSALTDPLDRLHRLKFSRQAIRQSLPMLHSYGRSIFQRDIHSWKAVKKRLA